MELFETPFSGDSLSMENSVLLLRSYGYPFVFFLVFLEQSGLPLPSFPVLLIAGAMIASGYFAAMPLLAAILSAAILPSFGWYLLGIRQGRKILSTLCKMSLSPDVCVRQTEDVFVSWGASALIVAKFIPGLSLIAPPLAGALGYTRSKFLALNTAGLLLYSCLPLALGFAFHSSVDQLLIVLIRAGRQTALVALGGVTVYLLWKWLKRRALAGAPMLRISVQELKSLLDSGSPILLVDVRSQISQGGGRIPGASPADVAGGGEEFSGFSKDMRVVVYCACPNEVSAIQFGNTLKNSGFSNVSALLGGIDAWEAAGHSLHLK
jgi:membrane protein DedA with SNARE-associated domain/rhodanese-related sulfurtransferase